MVTNVEKDPNSKLEVWFLLNAYHSDITVKLKNLPECETGRVCIGVPRRR
jgi:hypothetical protein